MRLRTDQGTRDPATEGDLQAALDRLEGSGDWDAFLVLEREDGAFLQMRAPLLEAGGLGDLRRARIPPAVRQAFRDFLEGKGEWDRGLPWDTRPLERRRSSLRAPEVLSAFWLRAKWVLAGMTLALALLKVFGRLR